MNPRPPTDPSPSTIASGSPSRRSERSLTLAEMQRMTVVDRERYVDEGYLVCNKAAAAYLGLQTPIWLTQEAYQRITNPHPQAIDGPRSLPADLAMPPHLPGRLVVFCIVDRHTNCNELIAGVLIRGQEECQTLALLADLTSIPTLASN